MSLTQIINSEHSAEFGQLMTEIKANVLSYLEARQKAQKERMIIIGKIAEYKKKAAVKLLLNGGGEKI